jgi:integrase
MTAELNSTPPTPSNNPMTEPAEGKPARPEKPSPDFPLYAHASGYWAKKINSRLYYFGKWKEGVTAEQALDAYNRQAEELHTGQKPEAGVTTVKILCNKFLNAKAQRRDAGELTPRSWWDYEKTCQLVAKTFRQPTPVSSLDPDDFAKLRRKLVDKGWGPATIAGEIQRVRVLFKFAWDNGLIDRPVRYGQGFDRPSLKTMRKHKAAKGPRLFSADEIRQLLDAASPQLRAMILLGINCGFGNHDCGTLPRSALDLDAGILDYARPKTGIPRRCVLWPETVSAIKEALAVRPDHKDRADAGLVFITKYGDSWAKDAADSPITKETKKLLNKLKIGGQKSFYLLRHTFRTIADESKDQPVCDYVMGHQSLHMSTVYRERIDDDRIRTVVEHVRAWLFPPTPNAPTLPLAGKIG